MLRAACSNAPEAAAIASALIGFFLVYATTVFDALRETSWARRAVSSIAPRPCSTPSHAWPDARRIVGAPPSRALLGAPFTFLAVVRRRFGSLFEELAMCYPWSGRKWSKFVTEKETGLESIADRLGRRSDVVCIPCKTTDYAARAYRQMIPRVPWVCFRWPPLAQGVF